jgi:NAD(P)-dependent dehydrogenase (short-subunit alcohol dehydrogenase family)
MKFDLHGRTALVTGGAHGVGAAIVRALAAEGAAVAINYQRSAAEADALAAGIAAAGGHAQAFQADVGSKDAVDAMVAEVVARFGSIDIVVNNAGVARRQRFHETTEADWTAHIGAGLMGPVHTAQAALPHMMARNWGRLIAFAGDSSRVGEAGLAAAAAARAGAIALMKSLAKEYGRYNVTANAISLGLVETTHIDPAWLEANRDKILRNYPIRRLGAPGDVSPLVALLASDAGAWITGQVVSVNGGFSMV